MRLSQKSGRSKKQKVKGPATMTDRDEIRDRPLETRIALIQQLIPLGLMAAAEELQREVLELAGEKHKRGEKIFRHGTNPGTILLGGQKVPVRVPRIRGEDGEISLRSYELLHEGVGVHENVLKEVLGGLSCSRHEAAIRPQEGSIGTSRSTVSRRFITASQAQLSLLMDRDLSEHDIVAIFVDGKYFADDQMVIALGITIDGRKVCLGFIQTETENKKTLTEFFRSLIGRGLQIEKGLLVIMDGAKGLRSAAREVFGGRSLVQRCQWHKRENIVGYLAKNQQSYFRKQLQKAYERPTLNEALSALSQIRSELQSINQSAVNSLDEGFEETLTLHELDVFQFLGASLKTTNCIESVNSMAEELCGKVDYWKNSSQKQRWLASALLDIEPRLRRIRRYKDLMRLRESLGRKLDIAGKGGIK